MKVIVFTATYKKFLVWCYENGVRSGNKRFVYAASVTELMGLHNCPVIRWGNYCDRDDYREMEYHLRILESEYSEPAKEKQ